MEQGFIGSLGLIIVAGAAFALVGRLARVPTIVLYIFAGLFLGPVTGLVDVTAALHLIAEIGIALLLFLVGLELSFNRIRDVGKVAVAAGLGQVVFTAAGGLGVCWLLGFGWMESVFLAIALTFSSTVVVVKLLDQKGDLNSLYGRIAVGIFLVQDIVVIFALTLLAGLGGGEAVTVASVSQGIGFAFGGMSILLVGVLVASRYLLPRPFAWAARSPQMLFIWSLCWCFLVVLGAEVLNLSLEIGAFLAGISLAQLPYSGDLQRRIHPLMNFFIAIFFVTLGIQMDLGGGDWGRAIVLSLFVLIGNPFIFMFIIARMKYSERTAFQTSVTVAQISEFSFIFAAMGVTTGLIGSDILSLVALVGLVTISVSAYMILYSDQLYIFMHRWGLLRIFGGAEEEATPEIPLGEAPVIIVGMNAMGRQLAKKLCAVGERVIAIDTDPHKLKDLPCETMLGDVESSSVLEAAEMPRARLLISALQIEDTNNFLAHRCKSEGVPACIHAFDLRLIPDLLDLDVRYLLTPKVDALRQQLRELETTGLIHGK